jgi:hypothetical protein
MQNEVVYKLMLVKEIFLLRRSADYGEDDLDLHLNSDAQFSANKLRTQLERLYMGVVSQVSLSVVRRTF